MPEIKEVKNPPKELPLGTEHWKTTYQTTVKVTSMAQAKADRAEWTKHKPAFRSNW